MPFVTTRDHTQLYVKDWGSGQPVVLIHGWPLSADSWDDVAVPLVEAGYRTIAYDRRGFGRSSQPWSGYDYDTLADDLDEVIEHCGAVNPILVGFSMGGGEVARYLSRHALRPVAKAVLVASILPFRLKTPDNPTGTEQAAFDRTAQALRTDRAKFFTPFFATFFGVGASTQPVSDELLASMHGIALQASLRATLECARAFSSTDFRPDLAAFRLPTLIIHGTEDKTVPIAASARLAAQGIPGSKLIEFDGSPHGLFATDRARLVKDLLEFFAA
jgi:non-heme chloroperoxidase